MHQPRQTDLNELLIDATHRRYDGGTEIELIQQIEAQQQRSQRQPERPTKKGHNSHKNHARKSKRPAKQQPLPVSNPVGREIPLTNRQSAPRWKHAVDTLLIGPLQIAIGAVGLLTSGLAMATFHKNKDEALVHQSKQVMKDCIKTFGTGFWFTAIAPIRFVKTLAFGPTLAA